MIEHVIHVLDPFDVPELPSRRVRVYVPPRRANAGPASVLYMFDGQNVFQDEPSFAGGWHLHAAVHRLAKRAGDGPVVVGIDHGGTERISELSPWDTRHGKGRADVLLDWITRVLLPRIHADFGVATAPDRVAIGGSSMGGLGALYGHFRHPDRFGRVLAMSPSLWLAGARLDAFVTSRPKPWSSRIYLDAGAREGGGHVAKATKRLADLLRSRGWDEGAIRVVTDRRGTHSEAAWRRRAPRALAFLFPELARKRS